MRRPPLPTAVHAIAATVRGVGGHDAGRGGAPDEEGKSEKATGLEKASRRRLEKREMDGAAREGEQRGGCASEGARQRRAGCLSGALASVLKASTLSLEVGGEILCLGLGCSGTTGRSGGCGVGICFCFCF